MCENIIRLIKELNFLLCRNSADDGNSSTLRKAGSKIATNGSLNMSKKHQSPVRQASVLHAQSWQEEPALNEEVVDDQRLVVDFNFFVFKRLSPINKIIAYDLIISNFFQLLVASHKL